LFVIGVPFFGVGCGVFAAVFWDDLKDGFQSVDLAKLAFFMLGGTMFVGGGIGMFVGALVAARRSVKIEMDATQLRIRPPASSICYDALSGG